MCYCSLIYISKLAIELYIYAKQAIFIDIACFFWSNFKGVISLKTNYKKKSILL